LPPPELKLLNPLLPENELWDEPPPEVEVWVLVEKLWLPLEKLWLPLEKLWLEPELLWDDEDE
jgi:hypothetical protein